MKTATLPVLLLLLLLLLLTTADPVAAGETRPVLRVSLNVIATDFVANLEDGKARVEQEVAATVAERGGSHFSYLRWVTGMDEDSGSPAAELILSLVDDEPAAGSVGMTHTAVIGDDIFTMPDLPAETVYRVFDSKPTHNPDLLIEHLNAFVLEKFANESFRDTLQDEFLSGIPLAEAVEAREEEHAIWLPVAWSEMRSTNESELVVEFRAVNEDEIEQDGFILLEPGSELTEGEHRGLQCFVLKFRFVPHRADDWHDAIPVVVGPGSLREAFVYMKKYVQKVGGQGTSGSQADEL